MSPTDKTLQHVSSEEITDTMVQPANTDETKNIKAAISDMLELVKMQIGDEAAMTKARSENRGAINYRFVGDAWKFTDSKTY